MGIDFGEIARGFAEQAVNQLTGGLYGTLSTPNNLIAGNTDGRFTYNQFNTQISILSGAYKYCYMGVISETTRSTTTPTHYPVESSRQIHADHVHINPRECEFTILVSGSHFFTPNQVYGALRALQEIREPVSIITNLDSLENMILTDINGSITPESNRAIINIRAVEVLTGSSLFGGLIGLAFSAIEGVSETISRGRVAHTETTCYRNTSNHWSCY